MRGLIGILLLLSASLAQAGDYVVVVSTSTSIENLSSGKLRDIFLKKRSFDGSVRVIPVNLLGNDPARREFEERVLNMEREELKRYWVTSHFQGIAPPATQASLQSVKSFVSSVAGAIGYLPRDMVDGSVRVVYEF
ncbi:MAG: hypothetical protein KDI36_05410 [Pseudomonadales bacterium]|nr:hypothetical protein [Pseudomonadales bacterium]